MLTLRVFIAGFLASTAVILGAEEHIGWGLFVVILALGLSYTNGFARAQTVWEEEKRK